MKLIDQLHKWRLALRFYNIGDGQQKYIPLTRDEIEEIQSDMIARVVYDQSCDLHPSQVFGHDVFNSPFATEMRTRQIEMKTTTLVTECEESRFVHLRKETWEDDVNRSLHRRLVASVVTDTTEVKVTFEWDIWATWKRRLKLTKRFPIKTKTVVIDGRVLYPYLNISLPHNRHHVQFAVR